MAPRRCSACCHSTATHSTQPAVGLLFSLFEKHHHVVSQCQVGMAPIRGVRGGGGTSSRPPTARDGPLRTACTTGLGFMSSRSMTLSPRRRRRHHVWARRQRDPKLVAGTSGCCSGGRVGPSGRASGRPAAIEAGRGPGRLVGTPQCRTRDERGLVPSDQQERDGALRLLSHGLSFLACPGAGPAQTV